MAKNPGKKRQKDLKRRLGQGRGGGERHRQLEALQARVGQELGDPQRFAFHLQRFAQLAMVMPELHRFRYPPGPFVDALLELELTGEGDEETQGKALRQALIPAVARPEHLDRFEQALAAAQEKVEKQEDLLALMAGRALVFNAREDPAAVHAPLWSIVCDLSLSEAALSGHFLIRLVRDAQRPDVAALAKHFARALNDPEVARDVDALGVDAPEPQVLAEAYATLVAEDEPYHLQFDAVLHLAALHVDLTSAEGALLTRVGPTPSLREAILRRHEEEAYRQDVTPSLVQELERWFRTRAKRINEDPSVLPQDMTPEQVLYEQRRSVVAFLAARTIPIEESHFLRAIHVMSLLLSRTLVDPVEAPFVARLWSEPTEAFALEEYEGFLLEQGETSRAKRVRAFQADARRMRQERAKREAAAEGGAGGEAPGEAGGS